MKFIHRILLPVALSLSVAGLAQADIYSDCQDAIASRDHVVVKGLAATILRFTNVTTGKKRRIGLNCINHAMSEEYVYDEHNAGFMPKTLAETQFGAREQTRKELAESQKRKKQILAELDADAAFLQAQDRARDAERKKAVWRRVLSACNSLYKTHPDQTVTNRVCLDLFLITGLPED